MTRRRGRRRRTAAVPRALRAMERGVSNVSRDCGRGELATLSNTSATGIFVVNAYVISTSLLQRWTQFASLFQMWRVKEIKFHYVSQIATTNNGRICMAIQEDPDGQTPTAFSSMWSLSQTVECAGRQNCTLTYKPRGKGWQYTYDLSLNEDRIEQPGLLYVCSGSFTSALTPGYVTAEYEVEWMAPCDSTTYKRRVEAALTVLDPDEKVFHARVAEVVSECERRRPLNPKRAFIAGQSERRPESNPERALALMQTVNQLSEQLKVITSELQSIAQP